MNTDSAILQLLADLQRDKAILSQRVAELEAERASRDAAD